MANLIFSQENDKLAVGIATFLGSIDIRAILLSPPIDPRLVVVKEGKMNKNNSILSCLSIILHQIPNENSQAVVKVSKKKSLNKVKSVILTLYAARIDITVKKYTSNKLRAIEVARQVMNNLECDYNINNKEGGDFTLTIYSFGKADSVETIGNTISQSLDAAGGIDGNIAPDYVKIHFTGCRREQDFRIYCNIFEEIFSLRGKNLMNIGIFPIMHIVTYQLNYKINNFADFVNILHTSPELSNYSIIYNNSCKCDQVTIMCPFDIETVNKEVETYVWRNNYDLYITIKNSGMIDQSSFSRNLDIKLRNNLIKIFTPLIGGLLLPIDI